MQDSWQSTISKIMLDKMTNPFKQSFDDFRTLSFTSILPTELIKVFFASIARPTNFTPSDDFVLEKVGLKCYIW